MRPDPSEAWRALKSTRRRLDRSRYREIPGSMPAKQPCRTGYSVREAVARLVADGVPAKTAAELVSEALRAHAVEVVESWGQWVERHGFLDEMSALSDERRQELLDRERWGELSRQVAILTVDPGRAVTETGLLRDLSDRAARLNRRDASHPAVFVLTHLHDLPAGLAEAAVARSATVPLWAFAFMALFILGVAGAAASALADIVAGRLESVPMLLGTGAFVGFFSFALVYLWRDRPRRERVWRDRVAAWIEESTKAAR